MKITVTITPGPTPDYEKITKVFNELGQYGIDNHLVVDFVWEKPLAASNQTQPGLHAVPDTAASTDDVLPQEIDLGPVLDKVADGLGRMRTKVGDFFSGLGTELGELWDEVSTSVTDQIKADADQAANGTDVPKP